MASVVATRVSTVSHRRRQEPRRRRHPSGLRLPVGERRLRARLRRRQASSSSARRPTPSLPWATRRSPSGSCWRPACHACPGYQGGDQADAMLAREAERIGFPVMVKAAAGGGGRGMRLVPSKKRAARRTRRGARGGHKRLRLRRADPREGRGRRAPRRDPDPRRRARGLHPSGRARLLGAAAASEGARGGALARRRSGPARAHGRRGGRGRPCHRLHQRRHGGVPARGRRRVLLPGDEHAPAGRAPGHRAGHRPRSRRAAVAHRRRRAVAESRRRTCAFTGHAIEARLYAEAPHRQFLPQSGELVAWRPPSGAGVRVDHGLREGQAITPLLRSAAGQDHRPWRHARGGPPPADPGARGTRSRSASPPTARS